MLVSDDLRLVQQFSVVIMQNPLHIYASALPFTPIESAIRRAYLPLFPSLPRVIAGLHQNWSSVFSIFGGRSQPYGGGSVRSIAFSVDGSRIAIASDDHIVRLWYHQSGTYFELKQHTAGVTSVSFSPDGAMMASSSHDGLACIWDATANTTSPVHILRVDDLDPSGHSLTSVAFSQDSQLVASGSSAGSIYVWDLSVDPPSKRQLSKHASWICSLVFVNDCSRMTSCSIDGKVCIWDTQTWDCIRQPWDRHLYGVNFVTLSLDGSRMAICFVDGSLKFEDIEYGSDAPLSASSRSVSIAISPDRHLGVAYSNDRSPLFSGFGDQISVNDTDAARKPISFVAFSPIRDHLSTRCTDGSIHLYSPPANRPTLQVICTDAGPAGPVVFADDGAQVAFSTSDGSIRTRDLTNERVRSIPLQQLGACLSCYLFPRTNHTFLPSTRMATFGFGISRRGPSLANSPMKAIGSILSHSLPIILGLQSVHPPVLALFTTTWKVTVFLGSHQLVREPLYRLFSLRIRELNCLLSMVGDIRWMLLVEILILRLLGSLSAALSTLRFRQMDQESPVHLLLAKLPCGTA